jgi:hypothetical protein
MIDLNAEIQARVASFAAGLAPLIRQAAIDAVSAALGGAVVSTKTRAKRPAAKSANAPSTPKRGRPARPAKGGKRDPKALAALVEKLHGYVKQHPGQRMEHIKAGLGLSKSDLVLPIKKLLADKRISAKGVKRSTAYTAR